MAFVSRPVILRQMLAASEEEAGGNSPITVFKPEITSTDKSYEKNNYYINCSGIASGSKSRKMVSHMCG